MLNPIRVGVLDRHEIARYGLCVHLLDQPGIAVSGSYANSATALCGARKEGWDLLLMGELLEHSNRVELIRILRVEQPALRFLVLLDQPHLGTAVTLMAAGAHGVVCKNQPLTDYVEAIRSLASGEFYFCCRLAPEQNFERRVSARHAGIDNVRADLFDSAMLTSREREVLRLCAGGLTVTQIAISSARSVKTISAQKQAAYRKLGLKNDLDLFRIFSLRSS
ncbi:LuxR C-terminal-related transcriptional regulator [Pseudomonas sp. LB3P14]